MEIVKILKVKDVLCIKQLSHVAVMANEAYCTELALNSFTKRRAIVIIMISHVIIRLVDSPFIVRKYISIDKSIISIRHAFNWEILCHNHIVANWLRPNMSKTCSWDTQQNRA